MKKVPVYGIIEFTEDKDKVAFYSNDLIIHLESHQFINKPHKHNTYISILFTKGSGEHQIDFDTFPVKPGSIFLLSPGQVHCWQLSSDVSGWVFFHTKEFYNSIFVNRQIEDFPFFYLQQNHPVIYLEPKDILKIEPLFQEINTEFNQNIPFRNAKLGSLTDLLYIILARLYHSEDQKIDKNSNYLKVKKLQKLIDENFKKLKLPSEYADLMSMSTRHLGRICQEVLNKTTSDLIIERIIIEAKRMLIHANLSVAILADSLGYEDYSYFTRMFKKREGLSPKEFQSKMKSSLFKAVK